MNTHTYKRTLLATGAFVAATFIWSDFALAAESPSLDGLGNRHIPFTGTIAVVTDDDLTILGRDADYRSDLTISVPLLGLTDLVIELWAEADAELDEQGNGAEWATLRYREDSEWRASPDGQLNMVGVANKVSETQIQHNRHYAGNFWLGQLAGVTLVATEQLTVITDSSGEITSSESTVQGYLVFPGYIEFALLDGVADLPPLEPVTPLPGEGWIRYTLTGRLKENLEGPDDFIISCDVLGFEDLVFEIPDPYWHPAAHTTFGAHFGNAVVAVNEQSWGAWGFYEQLGETGEGDQRDPQNSEIDRMEQFGALWDGPFAGCLVIMKNDRNSLVLNGELLVPPYVELGRSQRLINISTRGRVGVGDDKLIAGFVVYEDMPQQILIRAVGSSLEQFGLTDFLVDPMIEIFRDTESGPILVAENDDWRFGGGRLGTRGIETAIENAGAFPLVSNNDAAVWFSYLEPGAYTVQVSGVNDTSGVAIVEVYQIGYANQ